MQGVLFCDKMKRKVGGYYMVKLGEILSNIGWSIIPISFFSYFFVGILAYKWDVRYKIKPVKSIWYIFNAIMVISGDMHVDIVAVMILMFEAFDSLMDYFEEKKNRKK